MHMDSWPSDVDGYSQIPLIILILRPMLLLNTITRYLQNYAGIFHPVCDISRKNAWYVKEEEYQV